MRAALGGSSPRETRGEFIAIAFNCLQRLLSALCCNSPVQLNNRIAAQQQKKTGSMKPTAWKEKPRKGQVMKRASIHLLYACCTLGAAAFSGHALAADAPATQQAVSTQRLEFFGLVPGLSTKTDVELLLGDPVGAEEGRSLYSPPEQAADAERIEAVYVKGNRQLLMLDVSLKRPVPYSDLAAAAGQRVLLEKGADRTWEYRTPGFLGLGYPGPGGGTPQLVDRLRYVSPQFVADLFVARGEKAEYEKRSDDALTEYEKASRIDPRYALPYLRMGKLHEKSAADKALLYFTAATKADYPPRAKAEAYYLIGRREHNDNKAESAQKAYVQAIAEDSTYAPAYFWLGRLYRIALKKPQEAIAAFEKAIALKPEGSLTYYAWYNIGAVHEEQGNTKAAASAFRKAMEADPSDPVENNAKASHQLAWNLLKSNDFSAAEKACRQRLEHEKGDRMAMLYLAMALSSQAPERPALFGLFIDDPRLKESLEWLEKAVAAGYGDKAALEGSPYLKQLREQSSLSFNRLVSKIQK